MAYESYPNTPHNARAITLLEHEKLVVPLGLSGLVNYGNGTLPVFADSTGRQVKIRAGVGASIRGTRFNNISETVVAIGSNGSGNPRIDLVVLRLNRATYEITPVVIAGTAASAPVAPSAVRNEPGGSPDFYDIPLAEVQVPNGATTTTAVQVTNRAWWISGSGYIAPDSGRPPVEPGVVWTQAGSGIQWIGSSGGTYQRLYHYTGYVDIDPGNGWDSTTFAVARDGNLCTADIRIRRTGATISPSSSVIFGSLGPVFRPQRTAWGFYYASGSPSHVAPFSIQADGMITFSRDFANPIPADTVLIANLNWLAAA